MEKFEQLAQSTEVKTIEKSPFAEVSGQETVEKEKILAAEKKITGALVESTPGAEQAPGWIKEVSKKVADAWFDPKSFESQETYEKLGVRLFKKFMPSSGDYVYRLVWKKMLGFSDQVKLGDIESLKNAEYNARLCETAHVSFFALGMGVIAAQLADGNMTGAIYISALNTLMNVYPIMVQRYNHIRFKRNLDKMENRNARIHTTDPEEQGVIEVEN